jgi:CTP:molybdopterin cytidylyltransferase MocA
MSRIAAVVLAAGEATRFGAPKQRILLPRVLERLRKSSVVEIVVVAGAYELEPCGSEPQGVSCRIVSCGEWSRGPGASLRCGLQALPDSVDAAVVALADGPDLSTAAVERVMEAWREQGGGVVAASYEGARGHPLVVGREEWDGIPDDGLRDRPVRLVPCDDLGSPGDVDTPADLEKL